MAKEDTKRQPISHEMRGMQVQILMTQSHSSDRQRFKVDIMMMSESELTHGCTGNGWQVLRYFSLHSQGNGEIPEAHRAPSPLPPSAEASSGYSGMWYKYCHFI